MSTVPPSRRRVKRGLVLAPILAIAVAVMPLPSGAAPAVNYRGAAASGTAPSVDSAAEAGPPAGVGSGRKSH